MSYATPQDMQNRYPARDLIQLTDPAGKVLNATLLQQYLTDASTEIDSYIESRFALPFTDPPAILNQVCSDIAWYRLQVSRPLRDCKDAKERYDSRVKWLEKVRDGVITLGLTLTQKEPTIATPTVLVQSPTTMPRSSLDLYTDLFNRRRLSSF
jgi:phage gp36-like protein